jgi:hypothetical protein
LSADLHIHSNASDGSDTIPAIIEMAKKKGLDAIAITDHDTLSHLSKITHDPLLQVIGGIEISASHKKTNTKAHILGYSIQRPELVMALTQPLLEARNRNSEKQVTILQDEGFRIDMAMLARADGRYLYKQHIMEFLVNTNQIGEMFGGFYQSVFKNGGICDFEIEYVDVFDAIQSIKEAGGIAVLAHPGQQQIFWLIPDLVRCGLNGLELNHPSHNEYDKMKIREIAVRHGLFLTGGSDYHGKYEPTTFGIGDFLSDESGVIAICQK